MHEIELALGQTIRQEVMDKRKFSPVVLLLIEETTNIAVAKQLMIYALQVYSPEKAQRGISGHS